jgi:putative ATPase
MPETVSDGLFDVPDATSLTERAQGGSVAAPLAVRMRPASLDEVVGQDHLLQPDSPLRRLVEGSGVASVILYGPPGSGKTTLAALISQGIGRRFEALSALSAGVKEVRAVIDVARHAAAHGEQTVLFIDEVHRFSKTQQDTLLSAVENRVVLLVAATTENPSFSVVAPLLSRSLILALRALSADDIRTVVQRAIDDPRGLNGQIQVASDAVDLLVQLGAGDARRALTALEVAAEAGSRSPSRPSSSPWTRPRSATTATAISTTTSSARSSSRCAAPTSTPHCTTWPECWSPVRTRDSSRDG